MFESSSECDALPHLKKRRKTCRRSLFSLLFVSRLLRRHGDAERRQAPIGSFNFPPYSNFRRGARAVVIDLLLSLYKPSPFSLVQKLNLWLLDRIEVRCNRL